MLLRIGSRVRYQPEKVRAMARTPTDRGRLMAMRGTVTGWIGRERAIIQFEGIGPIEACLDHLEPD